MIVIKERTLTYLLSILSIALTTGLTAMSIVEHKDARQECDQLQQKQLGIKLFKTINATCEKLEDAFFESTKKNLIQTLVCDMYKLLAEGADVNTFCTIPLAKIVRDSQGERVLVVKMVSITTFHLAVLNNLTPCIDILVSANANIDAQTDNGDTPLLFASSGNHLDCVQKLVYAGVAIDKQNNAKYTPYIEAVEENSTAIITYLLEMGASEKLTDTRGHQIIATPPKNIQAVINKGITLRRVRPYWIYIAPLIAFYRANNKNEIKRSFLYGPIDIIKKFAGLSISEKGEAYWQYLNRPKGSNPKA